MFKKRGTNGPPSRAQRVDHLFHGVEIVAPSGCCEAAMHQVGQRFLSEEAPILPLAGCDRVTRCRCKYRHYTDRRTEARRDADVGLPPAFREHERRARRGRRVTD